jgi:hypothetical protein
MRDYYFAPPTCCPGPRPFFRGRKRVFFVQEGGPILNEMSIEALRTLFRQEGSYIQVRPPPQYSENFIKSTFENSHILYVIYLYQLPGGPEAPSQIDPPIVDREQTLFCTPPPLPLPPVFRQVPHARHCQRLSCQIWGHILMLKAYLFLEWRSLRQTALPPPPPPKRKEGLGVWCSLTSPPLGPIIIFRVCVTECSGKRRLLELKRQTQPLFNMILGVFNMILGCQEKAKVMKGTCRRFEGSDYDS